jgi:hypothetical protein
MRPETQHARVGYRRPQVHRPDGAATTRSGALTGEAARTGQWGAVARPSHAAPQARAPQAKTPQARAPQARAAAKRVSEDASIVRVIPLLAVLVVTFAGVYLSWHQGSTGGGEGGVVAGAALLVAAAARLLLPSRLAGLLAMRKRANDVVTLTIFGTGLLVAGLVLPG